MRKTLLSCFICFAVLVTVLVVNNVDAAVADSFGYPVGLGSYPLTDYIVHSSGDFLDVNYSDSGVLHPGEDINRGSGADDEGDPVFAVANGIIVAASFYNGYGNVIVVEHTLPNGEKVWSQYAHLNDMITHADTLPVPAWVGQTVYKGDRIGSIGNTGPTPSPHLHFEIRKVDLAPNFWPSARGWTRSQVEGAYYNPTNLRNNDYATAGFIESHGGAMPQSTTDVVLLVDTTGSMADDIDSVKAAAKKISDKIIDAGGRVALVDYRDFPNSPYGGFGDYPYRDRVGFTSSKGALEDGLSLLDAGGGGDWEESVLSAVIHCIDGRSLGGWRAGAKKSIIIMSDAPGHSPEPYTGYTNSFVLTAAKRAGIYTGLGGYADDDGYGPAMDDPGNDAIVLYPVVVGGDSYTTTYFSGLADGTEGKLFTAATAEEVPDAIIAAVEEIAGEIHAEININPKTVNSKSLGQYLTVYLELPTPFDVLKVDLHSIRLNGVIPTTVSKHLLADADADGNPDIVLKFPRDAILEMIGVGEQILVVQGYLMDGTRITASGKITSELPGNNKARKNS